MLEVVFSLSSSITENTALVQMVGVYPHRIRQIDSYGDCDNQGYLIQGDSFRNSVKAPKNYSSIEVWLFLHFSIG